MVPDAYAALYLNYLGNADENSTMDCCSLFFSNIFMRLSTWRFIGSSSEQPMQSPPFIDPLLGPNSDLFRTSAEMSPATKDLDQAGSLSAREMSMML